MALDGTANSIGKVDAAEAEYEKRGTLGWAKLARVVHVMTIDLGGVLAPALLPVVEGLTSILKHIAGFAEAHPLIVKIGMDLAAIGASATLAGECARI